MIHASIRRTAVASFVLALSASVLAAPAGKAFVTVNGKAIPQSIADTFISEQVAQGATDNEELRKAVREELARRESVAQAARAQKLDKRPDVQARIALAQQEVLIRALIQDHVEKNPVTDAQLGTEYDRIKGGLVTREFKARHVLLDTEEQAKAVIARLDGGASFAELAKDSKDPGSKDNGGDLGWNQANVFVKPFADTLGLLEKGKYTAAPVKTQFGYHVIQLDDARSTEPPPLEQIKPQLMQHLQQQQIAKLIEQIRAKAKVE